MSANLLDGATVTRGTKDADGYWVLSQNDGTDKRDSPMWRIYGQPTLTENQTVHMACSVMPDEDLSTNAIHMGVEYRDAAGNAHWTGAYSGKNAKAGVWTRLEMKVVVPSGMRVNLALLSNAHSRAAGAKVTGVTISYGSPVVLASSAHTPYATQDHVSVTYATKASLKVTDDSIKTEVSARAQTDQNVADLSSRLTQTANSLSSEISDRKSAITTVTGLANAAQSTADSASEQTVELSSRLDQTATDITATIESKVQTVQQGVDGNTSDVKDLNDRLSDEIRTRKSFMRFSEESSDPTLTLGQTDSPAQVKLTNKQLQFLYLNTVVAYMSGDALLINNAKILQQLQLGGFAFVPRDNGNLAFKWVGGDS